VQDDHDAVPAQVFHVDGVGNNPAPGADNGAGCRQAGDHFPFLFPEGIPAIVFAAIVGILLNVLFVILPPSKFGVKERSNIEF